MNADFQGWSVVGQKIEALIGEAEAGLTAGKGPMRFDEGQIRSLRSIAERLPKNGVILADEVGMGKTRIAAAVARAVIEAGGRVAFLIPAGLGSQWKKELRIVSLTNVRDVVRSLKGYFDGWCDGDSPWFGEKAVMISHAFTNWRLRADGQKWRWALLPLAWSAWKGGKLYGANSFRDSLNDGGWLDAAARAISWATKREIGEVAHARLRQCVFKDFDRDWGESRKPASYSKVGSCRERLEQLIGIGFGTFDLIVIDEAHKSREDSAALSFLLGSIVIASPDSRRLALTATPVELYIEQWLGMFKRIGVSGEIQKKIEETCRKYAKALQSVQDNWHTIADSPTAFGIASREFEEVLRPYVLRRDKREDETIRSFMAIEGESIGSYRRYTPILIRPERLAPRWLDAVIAAEGLSAIRHSKAPCSKSGNRLWLTVANGHGIARMMDAPVTAEDGIATIVDESVARAEELHDEGGRDTASSQARRVDYWRKVLCNTLSGTSGEIPQRNVNSVLYAHPAIVEAVAAIEELTALKKKVLVFGRYTLPMKALEQILNAREMLRHLKDSRDWPQSTISTDLALAVDTALKQMGSELPSGWSREDVSQLLFTRFNGYERKREIQRDQVRHMIKREYPMLNPDSLIIFARAVLNYLGASDIEISSDKVIEAARRIAASLSDDDPLTERDESDADDPEDYEVRSVGGHARLAERLKEEYDSPRSGIARLMNGETKAHARRNLQLKFNRVGCFPYVLIAQSTVGREGLNLQEECRNIILLHPEWNPGIVEQQIGRVDRLNSRWANDFKAWNETGRNGEIPRIEIRPVMFKGTYDEHNCAVLEKREALMRAQLHGIIVSAADIGEGEENKKLAAEVNKLAPSLSP